MKGEPLSRRRAASKDRAGKPRRGRQAANRTFDCHGVDTLAQAYLQSYLKVVFYIGARPRTNLGFDTVRVAGSRQADKDTAMAAGADYGLAIWDGRSPGTARNIKRVGATKIVRQRFHFG